ncbi:methyl-accepting chemotaxis protein [Robbsia sp. Bb-Pol-6]|uniref:Methyl-accepting chemotaxis protein n=1 Tax=Robbsia betulipollinis TaxID=2981849 RepID=A0ABT3ZKP6_9BURK|nr:methyl-accepting chemotaxis protein [Robbsia betulipollinis]MCY0386992.1 methyl-accepting chemotaxis protein [Robbsia betulipollinis]
MKIGMRLAATFGAVLGLLLVICISVSLQMARMNDNTQAIVSDLVVRQRLVADLKQGTYSVALLMYRALDEKTPEGQKALVARLTARINVNTQNYGKLEALMATPADKAAFADMVRVRTIYSQALKPAYAQIDANDVAGARATLSNVGESQRATFAALDDFGRLQQRAMDQSVADSVSAYGTARAVLWGVAALAFVIAIFLCIVVTRTIVEPLRRVMAGAERLADGDLSVRIDVARRDETGMLAGSLNRAIGQLAQIVGGVKQASDAISTATLELSAGNTDLAQRTEEQAASLEQTAASVEELTASVRQNSENAKQANQVALTASTTAQASTATIGEVVDVMGGIARQSQQIAGIVETIEGIAFQTNILALNAAVEAARAGEQGRGFAVVASEVRALAQRSAAAAKEVKRVVDDSVSGMANGVQLAERAGNTMRDLSSTVGKVTDLMGEIAAASAEQSQGIDQVNQAVSQMDQITQQNAALVEEASAAAQSMKDQANGLNAAVATFTLDIVR